VLPSLGGGGAERVAVTILNGLEASAWDRSMYLFERKGPFLEELSPLVRVSSGNAKSRGRRVSSLRQYFARTRPDVIVTFLSYVSVLVAARLAKSGARIVFNLGTPVSAFLQDPDYVWASPWRRFLFAMTARLVYPRADLIVATSAGVRDDLCDRYGINADRVRIVHNPIDLTQIAAASREPLDEPDRSAWVAPVVVAAGRLAHAKNVPLLIDAFALLRRSVDARLFVLGQGEEESAVRERVTQHGLADSVRLCGFKQNPWRYIAKADVFALTSRYEGFGNVLIEAMACGVPVVAAASPGSREVVSDGVNGLLVEDHRPADVALALERIVSNPALRSRLAAGARDSAAAYAVPEIVGTYERLFEELAA
jgi:glycosyltransferase involved in cell wall biosynthesis